MPGRHRAATPGRHRAPGGNLAPVWSLCVLLTMLSGSVVVLGGVFPRAPVAHASWQRDAEPAHAAAVLMPRIEKPRRSEGSGASPGWDSPKATATPRQKPTTRPTFHSATPTPRPTPTRPAQLNPDRWQVITYARSQIGKPYAWGAVGPDAYDCSGLMLWAFARAGYRLPRVSSAQALLGNPVPLSRLEPGDLVAWPGHVALYVGRGRIVEAPRPGLSVRERALGSEGGFDAQAWGVSLDYTELPR